MSANLQQALHLHRSGDIDAALPLYAQVLAEFPADPAALYYGGVAAWMRRDGALALDRLNRLLATPAHVTAEAYYHRGLVLSSLGQIPAAIADYRSALVHKPALVQARLNLGNLLRQSGQHDAADEAFREALRYGASPLALAYNRSLNWSEAGRHDLAKRQLEICLQHAPDDAEIRSLLTHVLVDMGQAGEAVTVAREGLRRLPTSVPLLNALAQAEEAAGQVRDALATYRRAVELDPDHPGLALNLALLERENAEHETAVETYRRLLSKQPAPGVQFRLATLIPVIARSEQEIDDVRKRFSDDLATLRATGVRLANPVAEFGDCPFYLSYHGRNDDRRLLAELAATLRQAAPDLAFRAPHCDAPRRPGRIRVGFCSHFLFDHSIGQSMHAIIAGLPRDEFEVHIFRLSPFIDDALSKRIVADATEHRLSTHLASARDEIAQTQLDLLIYPEIGSEAFTYFLAHARLAPRQWNTLGHPCTSGLPDIDAYVSYEPLEPPGNEEFYSESLLRLPAASPFPAYPTTPLPPFPASRRELALPEQASVLICPQSLFKLLPAFDSMLARILAAGDDFFVMLPEGVLPGQTVAMRSRLAGVLGKLVERVKFFPRTKRERFLEVVNACDVMLDPFPVGGGITTWDALVTGIPIVTLPGQQMRSRFTATALSMAGIESTIARDPDHYAEIAIALLQSPDRRQQLRQQLSTAAPAIHADTRAVDGWIAAIRKAVAAEPAT